MSIGLDNPGLLPLVPLVAGPLLLHLMARPRPRLLAYPSLMLLERAHRNNARIKRPHHWLLLILRTLWVACMVGVFLQPRYFTERPLAGLEEHGRNVVVVLDATASMRAGEGAQSRYARAGAEAADILRHLSARDRANVIRARALPESLYAEPGVNKSHLIDEIRRLPATLEGGSLHEAYLLAVSQLRDLPGPREIVILSDFQPGGWDPADFQVPEGVTVRLLPVATESVPNQAVTGLRVYPPAPVAGQPFTVEVDVRNFSAAPVRRSLVVRVGERREQRSADLPAGGSALITVPMEIEDSGTFPVAAELEADAFPADNIRRGTVSLQASLRAAVYGSDDTARVWLRGLDALPGVTGTHLTRLQDLADTHDVLLISGWDGAGLELVTAFVERGGLLMVRPGNATAAANAWLGLRASPGASARLEPARSLRVPEPWPDLLSLFADGRYGSPARGLVSRFAPLSPEPGAHEPLLLLESGEPIWLRHRERPSVFLWAVTLSPEDSTLSAQVEWVSLFGEWLFRARPSRVPAPADSGDVLLTPRGQLPAARPELVDPQGEILPLRVDENTVRAAGPLPPGFYRYRNADSGGTLQVRAVNLPAAESDLTARSPEELDGGGLTLLSRATDLNTLREGRPLWPLLVALAFLFALLEHLATLRGASFRAVRT